MIKVFLYILQALNIQFTSKKTQKAPQSEVQMEFMKFTEYNFRDPNLETFCLFIYPIKPFTRSSLESHVMMPKIAHKLLSDDDFRSGCRNVSH